MNNIITGPGVYKTRNGKKVTIHEIRQPPGHEEGNTSFPAKGSIWKNEKCIGTNPGFGIWQLNGKYRAIGDHPLDIVASTVQAQILDVVRNIDKLLLSVNGLEMPPDINVALTNIANAQQDAERLILKWYESHN